MVLSNHVTGWAVLLSLSILSLGTAIISITLRRSVLRSLDIFILAILTSLLLNASISVGIHIYVDTNNKIWTTTMCNMYIWMSFSFNAVELLFLTALSIDRSSIFHTSGNYSFRASPVVALVVASVCLVSVLLGSIPVLGMSKFRTMDANNRCTYLADEIHLGFAIGVIIFSLTFMIVCIIILIDTLIQWRHIKRSSMFSVPPAASNVPVDSVGVLKCQADVQHMSRYIAMAFENCRIVCVIAALLMIINHLPYIVLSFMGIINSDVPAETRRQIVVWLQLLVGFLVPNCLWLCNTQYRAAYKGLAGRVFCLDIPGHQVVHLESYTRRDTPDVCRSQMSSVTSSFVSQSSRCYPDIPQQNSSIPETIEYVGNIWRPVCPSKAKEGQERVMESFPSLGNSDTKYDESTYETWSREPPDGSSRTSLNEHLMVPHEDYGAMCAPTEKYETNIVSECSKLEMELDENMKRLGEHQDVLYIQGFHWEETTSSNHTERDITANTQIFDRLPGDELRNKAATRQEAKRVYLETHTYSIPECPDSGDSQVILYPKSKPQNKENHSNGLQITKSLPSMTLLDKSKPLVSAQTSETFQQKRTDSHIKQKPSQNLYKSVKNLPQERHKLALVSKRQQWLEHMRSQCLPAPFLESITSGEDLSPMGFIRMRYRNIRRRLHRRRKSDGDSQSYPNKGFDWENEEVLEMDAFKNYRNTIVRKGHIKFRRARKVTIPMDTKDSLDNC